MMTQGRRQAITKNNHSCYYEHMASNPDMRAVKVQATRHAKNAAGCKLSETEVKN